MEKLVITNFLSIEHAEIEIKKINLFIGPQAQGKSLISKLIYFFKEYPQSVVQEIYLGLRTEEEFKKFAVARFEKIFPKYTWKNLEFCIKYSNKYYSILINNRLLDSDLKSKPKYALTLTYDPIFLLAFDNQKNLMEKSWAEISLFSKNTLVNSLFSVNKNPYIEEIFYIPAGRSFFANLDKSIFSLLGSDVKIDNFLMLFGKTYEKTRESITLEYDRFDDLDNASYHEKKPGLDNLVKNLIGGDYLFENGQDWIANDKGRIRLVDASSGQQESLPMVIILSNEPYLFVHNYSKGIRHRYANHFIIEEPEAHLFPIAQNEIVLLIANAYNHLKGHKQPDSSINSFTIATHSPYILTAFNNLIQAGNVAASKNYQDLDALRAVVPESEWVDFNDVTAYVVNNGTVKSILNQELKLIDANMIDEVSDHLADKFRELLGMEIIDE